MNISLFISHLIDYVKLTEISFIFQSELIGFYDPCVGEEKQLKIDYTFKETSYSVTISDKDELQLPQGELIV